jgi:serine protease inhibitor
VGLDATSSRLNRAQRSFVDINNELGFKMYRSLLDHHGTENLVFSPLSLSTSLAMMFLGARSSTSWQMNELLRFDEMISFNPHLLYKNVTDALAEGNGDNGGLNSACVKQLFVDKVSKSGQGQLE